jgi:hypothetical protein
VCGNPPPGRIDAERLQWVESRHSWMGIDRLVDQ